MSDAPKPMLIQSDLDQSYELPVGDKTLTIVMTFGRLNRLCKMLGGMNEVQRMIEEPEVAEQMMIELLSTKKNRVDPDEMAIKPEDASKLLAWAGTHILDFFIKLGSNFSASSEPLMAGMQETVKEMQGKSEALREVQTSLTVGSDSSPGATASA
jgi:hypothetical protein